MDKLAIISDIHGNIPALEAVLEDIERRNIKYKFCLGDLAGKGPSGSRAIRLIREHCEVVIQGNWDSALADAEENKGLVWDWHRGEIGSEGLEYLKGLSFAVDFRVSEKDIRLVHASPQSVWHRVLPWSPLTEREAMFDTTTAIRENTYMWVPGRSEMSTTETEHNASRPVHERRLDIVGYGDIHTSYLEHIQNRTLFNTGSVGNPLDLPLASYVIVEGALDSVKSSKEQMIAEQSRLTAAPFSIQFVRVRYDIDKAIAEAKTSGMPFMKEYEQELRTARYRGSNH